MLPPHCDASTASAAERRLFELFQTDPGTNDWIVLHSLGLSRRGNKPYGEIDFVVLVPGGGVLCLEVKGGRVSCADGRWTTLDRDGNAHTLGRSPFLQAREGMFALRDCVRRRASTSLADALLFGYLVVMPDIEFEADSPEWERWQVLDRSGLRRPVSATIRGAIRELRSLHPAAAAGEPSPGTIGLLQRLLRPDFEAVLSSAAQIEQADEQLIRLTQDQFVVLDQLAANDRCIFEGAAGTGKTMLALEYARRAAERGPTLLICYNRLLGDWFARSAAAGKGSEQLTAGAFYGLLREVIVQSSIAPEFTASEKQGQTSHLYEEIYPSCGRLAIEERGRPFDTLVVDEAQDLVRPGVLDVLDVWLKGGLAAGKWALFGDFNQQAIFGPYGAEDLRGMLKERAPVLAFGRLMTNCRNTRNIGEETALLSGFPSPPYRMGQILGAPVDYRYYNSSESQAEILNQVVQEILAGGTKASDIVVLSQRRLANSGAAAAGRGDLFRLLDIGEQQPARSRVPIVRFATAQAFKGMESPVVILCDIEQVSGGGPQALLYVAMSRARSKLTLVAHSRVRGSIADFVRRKLQDGWTSTS